MTDDAFEQEPEQLASGAIWLVGLGVVAISAVLIAIAWWFVVPPSTPDRPVAAPSPLEHGLIDRATAGEDLRAAGARQLERYEWVDRAARTVRIPIDRAIDAVVADPRLIGTRSPAIVGARSEAVGDVPADRRGPSSGVPATSVPTSRAPATTVPATSVPASPTGVAAEVAR